MSNKLSGTSVLVTGADGFIGAHLVARLIKEGAAVCGLVQAGRGNTRLKALGVDHCSVAVNIGDTHSYAEILNRFKPGFIFHLAAERNEAKLISTPNWSATTGVALMQAAASPRLQRFVTIGSSLEIPDPISGLPIGPHGVAKARAMQAMQAASIQVKVPFSALRTHYVYGPLHGAHKLIPTAIRAAATGIEMPATGANIRKRFVYVLDIVDACLQVLNLPADPDTVYMTTSETQYSNHEVILRIGQLMGKSIRMTPDAFSARAWDRPNWELPENTSASLPGWSARTDLDQGLGATIAAEMCDASV
ncbi:MAG: hypothetical protein COB16_16895 [Rhodobacteraceae bacterium]|nr:MAG: hypothetical protein COB16_16895 [Paracoccaceae bacterium]